MMDPYFSKPKKWEQILGFIIIFLFFLSYYCKLKILFIFAFIFLTFATLSQKLLGVGKKVKYKNYVNIIFLKTVQLKIVQVAQLVEQRTENPCVSGSIPFLDNLKSKCFLI